MLLETGRTSKIQGFISRNGKSFDAVLKLEDGKVVFDFPNSNGTAYKSSPSDSTSGQVKASVPKKYAKSEKASGKKN